MASDHAGGDGPPDDHDPEAPGSSGAGDPRRSREASVPTFADTDEADDTSDTIVGRRPSLPDPPSFGDDPALRATEVAPWTTGPRAQRRRPSTTIPRVPDDELGGSLLRPLGRGSRGRVTIDFTGPPLDLPDAPTDPSEPPFEAPELAPPRSPSSVPPAEEISHDGWVTDRVRRTTPPPMLGVTSPAPIRVPQDAPLEPIAELPGKPDSIPPAQGDALTLVERQAPSVPDLDLMAEVRDRYALDDLTGALQAAELVLGATPDHPQALEYAESCRRRLEQLYAGRVGSMSSSPIVAVRGSEVRWLGLDHRAGFLLSQAAAAATVEELLDISGMPRLEALKTLVSLLDAGAIRLE